MYQRNDTDETCVNPRPGLTNQFEPAGNKPSSVEKLVTWVIGSNLDKLITDWDFTLVPDHVSCSDVTAYQVEKII